jgi:hypothetical protein
MANYMDYSTLTREKIALVMDTIPSTTDNSHSTMGSIASTTDYSTHTMDNIPTTRDSGAHTTENSYNKASTFTMGNSNFSDNRRNAHNQVMDQDSSALAPTTCNNSLGNSAGGAEERRGRELLSAILVSLLIHRL